MRGAQSAEMKKPKTIVVYMGDVEGRRHPAVSRWAGQRVYVSREAMKLPFGTTAPAPDSWALLEDKPIEYRGGRVYFPEFELEPTARAPGRAKFYYITYYGRDGRDERAPDGNTFVLPHHLGPEIFVGDLFGYVITYYPHLNTL